MLAAYLKNRFGANEVVSTIMLNYIAIFITGYLVTGPMIETVGLFAQTPKISENARLWRFLPPTRLHIGFIIAIVLAILLYILIFKPVLDIPSGLSALTRRQPVTQGLM